MQLLGSGLAELDVLDAQAQHAQPHLIAGVAQQRRSEQAERRDFEDSELES
jgi:hypothetical protein